MQVQSLCLLSFLFAWMPLAQAESGLAAQAINLLQQRCSQCHSDTVSMSGLRLTSRDSLLKGGTRGPAIVPGDALKSRLYLFVSQSAQPAMPPGKPMAAAEIAVFRDWINAGATWADAPAVATKSQWWSFQKPVRPPVPAGTGEWVHNPIDAFILAKLNAERLKPAAEAERAQLVRRAYFDLHGLPPTPDQVRAFLNNKAPDAWEKLIDELLASPRYGEKWGRHWLDLVRYGDTSGFEQDPYNLEAWRFRDYVIKSFNDDKPYDRFVKEQIAGEEIWPDDPHACTGTGYFCVGANRDMLFKVEDQNKIETLTDYVDTTSSVFLGLSVGCARCHDHKFDPIPQRDYYRMQAIFAPAIKTRVFLDYNPARNYDLGENSRQVKLRQIGDEIERVQARSKKILLEAKFSQVAPEVRKAYETDESKRTPDQQELVEANKKKLAVRDDDVRAGMTQEEAERLHAIEKRLVSMYAGYKPPPMAPGIMDVGREAPRTYIAVRGNPLVRGDRVEPGFLTTLGGGDVKEPAEDATTTGRRRALAEWLVDPENPLTARVMVNRLWHYHFGRGIVATPSDYGTRGQAPSHPELLDWLAAEFVQKGWSMKQMHRLIMTSSTYRQSARAGDDAVQRDPQNIFLSHASRRRLESEELRDAMLLVSGDLNPKMGGMPVVPPLDKDELYGIIGDPANAWVVTSDTREHTRRSIYLLSRRAFRAPMFELFDSPDGILPCPRREASTIAPQSLTLLNGRFTVDQARSLASKLEKLPAEERLANAWWSVLGREPNPAERAKAEAFLATQTKHLGSPSAALQELARGLFNINEFLYVE
ncbi:MAG TPA: PSD1 and planctomycete cytochrome C domain-containing protein [Bryobacteraceae bacterium]|nr:PSD1 and planctomycete cytochrome C domain-containing protein [Bryobacteraceae bacterium]